ncbi:MAG TPA: DNA integrity scanning protein DisA nucleotide-binding domain protein [Opitutaceae bacterium]
MEQGLRARHVAAAAMSAQTGAIAVVISESSGVVTIFADGAAVLEREGRG